MSQQAMTHPPTRTEVEAAADTVCSLLLARLLPVDRWREACLATGIAESDLDDARLRRQHDRYRPPRRAEMLPTIADPAFERGAVRPSEVARLSRLNERQAGRRRRGPLVKRQVPTDPRADRVLRAVSEHCGLTVPELLSRSRVPPRSFYRHVAVAATRSVTGWSYPALGRFFGGRDHTTILHSCRSVENDPAARELAARFAEQAVSA